MLRTVAGCSEAHLEQAAGQDCEASQQLTVDGHDAVHVRDRGVDGRPDPEVAAVTLAVGRALVTENVQDFFLASAGWSSSAS